MWGGRTTLAVLQESATFYFDTGPLICLKLTSLGWLAGCQAQQIHISPSLKCWDYKCVLLWLLWWYTEFVILFSLLYFLTFRNLKQYALSQEWQMMPIISALGRLWQKVCLNFKARLGYRLPPYLTPPLANTRIGCLTPACFCIDSVKCLNVCESPFQFYMNINLLQ